MPWAIAIEINKDGTCMLVHIRARMYTQARTHARMHGSGALDRDEIEVAMVRLGKCRGEIDEVARSMARRR